MLWSAPGLSRPVGGAWFRAFVAVTLFHRSDSRWTTSRMMLPATDMLEKNLRCLRARDPELAERVAATSPVPLAWTESKQGVLTGSIDHGGRPLSLASRYDPVAEAARLAGTVDHAKHPAVVVLGVALGHHVAAIARDLPDSSLLIAFEPSRPLLRAVFERIDCSSWLGKPNVMLADEAIDRAGLLRRLDQAARSMAQGTTLVTHPPSRQLHGEALQRFGQMITEVLAYQRTNLATAMVNASRTFRNLCLNLPHYVAGPTIAPLHRAATGQTAVCVGAGPSLARNVDQLRDPDVRQRVVVITAQTTLKPLLDRGIKPDFVTALDYAEISRRFYEGLPPLPDVTLVAEPLANPAILESFPGPVRVTQSQFLDLLVDGLARPIPPIRYGTTVAHLSFYLAQYLGCDPIVLIGQDLAFSDGLYYCPGTAIHDVWAGELNPFNTVEMLEWQRVVRHRNHLQPMTDIAGQTVYSDEQMVTYLRQFERDFAEADQRVLDATEGGVPKAGTEVVTLAAALAETSEITRPPLPSAEPELDRDRLACAREALQRRRDEVIDLRQASQQSIGLLRQMLDHQHDRRRMQRLFDQLDPIRQRVARERAEVMRIVGELNAVGSFRRARADRALHFVEGDQYDRQRHQLERDIENLDWLTQTCDEALAAFGDAMDRLGRYLPTGA
jgi:hypothetical protein